MFRIFFIIISFFIVEGSVAEDYYLISHLNKRDFTEEKVLIYHNFLDEYQKLIGQKLCKFKRHFSYLDLGAIQPNMNQYIKNNFDVFMISLKNQSVGNKKLFKCEFNSVFMNTNFSIQNISRLSECEFFDAVVVFNPFLIFGKHWEIVLEKILNLGFLIFIEIPPVQSSFFSFNKNDFNNLESFLVNNGGILLQGELMKILGAKVYFFEKNKKKFYRGNFIKPTNPLVDYQIKVDYEGCFFTKNYYEINQKIDTYFTPGINLLTFLMLNGVIPSRDLIKENIKNIIHCPHGDFMPHNMILMKNGLQMIDFEDYRQNQPGYHLDIGFCKRSVFDNLMKIVESNNTRYIEDQVINSLK